MESLVYISCQAFHFYTIPAIMKIISSIILLAILFFSCNKEKLCNEAETSSPGTVLSITGPDTLSVGKTVALIVEVATNDSFCIKRADGYIVDANSNYLQIEARLIHVAAEHKDCDCIMTPTIKTLIYFTPNKGGRYIFGTKKMDGNLGSAPGDPSNYQVFVQ